MQVAAHYMRRGYILEAERWRRPSGGIDLVLQCKNALAFVEVKRSKTHSIAVERIGDAKLIGSTMRRWLIWQRNNCHWTQIFALMLQRWIPLEPLRLLKTPLLDGHELRRSKTPHFTIAIAACLLHVADKECGEFYENCLSDGPDYYGKHQC